MGQANLTAKLARNSLCICSAPACERLLHPELTAKPRQGGGRKHRRQNATDILRGRACLHGFLSLLNPAMGKSQTSLRQPENKNLPLFQTHPQVSSQGDTCCGHWAQHHQLHEGFLSKIIPTSARSSTRPERPQTERERERPLCSLGMTEGARSDLAQEHS